MSTPQAPTPGDVTLTREEQAFFIKSFWEASMAPDWTNDPLIELGKAVGAKIPLQRLTTRQLDTLWPFLLLFDELWSLSPFLLLHHINFGLALACTTLLVYSPFAQRSLVLMGAGRPKPEAENSLPR